MSLLLICFVLLLSGSMEFDWSDSGEVRWAMGCDFDGGDVDSSPSNGESCGGVCFANPSCSHFTWTDYDSGTCWLKSGAASESSAIYQPNGGAVCGFIPSRVNSGQGDIRGTYWADQTDAGGCQMPEGNYAVNDALALGQIGNLGPLVWRNALCGQMLGVNCGGQYVEAVVASTCNLGSATCGVDMIRPTWNKATGNKPPGVVSCTVQLLNRNPLQDNGPQCFYRPNSPSDNPYYASLGVINTSGRLVRSATVNGVSGNFQSGSQWIDFNGSGFQGSAQVIFYFEDNTSARFTISQCRNGGNVHIWS